MSAKKNKRRPYTHAPAAGISQDAIVAVANKADNPGIPLLKEEALVWLFAILATVAVYIVTALIIQKVYNPDIIALKNAGTKLLIAVNTILPEPKEAMLFRVGVVVISLGLLVFYRVFSRMKKIRAMAATPLFTYFSLSCLAGAVVLFCCGLMAKNQFGQDGSKTDAGSSNFAYYFKGLFL